jgi:hypothetical protein
MMRIVAIALALLAGLASLFVSVCGGGFFVITGYQSIRGMLHPTGTQTALFAVPLLMLAAACAAVGGWVFWQCIKFIRRESVDRD